MIRDVDDDFYRKYDTVYGIDIIPDTDYGVYTIYNTLDNTQRDVYISSKEIDILRSNKDIYYDFRGIAVTHEYHKKACDIKEEYEYLKSCNDGIRSDDDQYDDPMEWNLYDEYSKFWKEGNWSNLYWDFA